MPAGRSSPTTRERLCRARTWGHRCGRVLATYLLSTGIKGTSSMNCTGIRALHKRRRGTWRTASGKPGTNIPQALPSPQGEEQTHQPEDPCRAGDRGGNRRRRDERIGHECRDCLEGRRYGRPDLTGVSLRTTPRRVRPSYTYDHTGHHGLPHHTIVHHSVKQYVDGQVQTNRIEYFWALLKLGSVGMYYKMSGRYLSYYHRVRRGL